MSSMTDRQFVKSFSTMIAALVALTVVIYILAQMVASNAGLVKKSAAANASSQEIADRIKPVGQVNIAARVANGAVGVAQAADGKGTYNTACVGCHGSGAAGAPKLGDKAAWAPRIAKGMDALYGVALKGKPGTAMMAKGGNASLSDAAVKAATDYMVGASK